MNGQDELSGLAGEINKMLAALGRSEEALRKAHDELEIRVQQRTAELSATNERFRKIISSFTDHIYVTKISPDMPELLWGDPVRLQQVINNLVVIAIKFTQHC